MTTIDNKNSLSNFENYFIHCDSKDDDRTIGETTPIDRVICILVLYNPSVKLLEIAIESIISQVDLLWISDNTPQGTNGIETLIKPYGDRIKYKLMNGNEGIASAQNAGIQFAIEEHYNFIYFLDQDSISPEDIILSLKSRFNAIKFLGVKIGGIGPQPYNRVSGHDYIQKGDFFSEELEEVREIMNSGSLISTHLFEEVGMMDAPLFIDAVDYELCWRANYLESYRFFILCKMRLSHMLGEGDKHLLGRTLKISSSFRTYYQFRNWFILARRKYVPLSWKIRNGLKYIIKYIYFPIFVSPRWDYFRNINRGIIDGIMNRYEK